MTSGCSLYASGVPVVKAMPPTHCHSNIDFELDMIQSLLLQGPQQVIRRTDCRYHSTGGVGISIDISSAQSRLREPSTTEVSAGGCQARINRLDVLNELPSQELLSVRLVPPEASVIDEELLSSPELMMTALISALEHVEAREAFAIRQKSDLAAATSRVSALEQERVTLLQALADSKVEADALIARAESAEAACLKAERAAFQSAICMDEMASRVAELADQYRQSELAWHVAEAKHMRDLEVWRSYSMAMHESMDAVRLEAHEAAVRQSQVDVANAARISSLKLLNDELQKQLVKEAEDMRQLQCELSAAQRSAVVSPGDGGWGRRMKAFFMEHVI